MHRDNLIKKAARWAEKQGLMSIKANHENYESPSQFSNPIYENPIVPDVTGMRAGGKFYIEVATKSDAVKRKISKWQLLSKLAQIKGGKLFLLAPRGHKAFVQRILEKYQINAKLVYWQGVA